MKDWLPLGKHRYYVEDDDLFVLEGHGDISLADMKQIFAVCLPIGDKFGYWRVLVDATAGVGMSPQARRHVAEASRNVDRLSVTAIYGTGLLERTLLMFLRNGIRMMHGVEMPMELFKQADDARAWLTRQRPVLQAKCARRREIADKR